jgi:uncharacterized membrane protein YqgA involved in biofilm formation
MLTSKTKNCDPARKLKDQIQMDGKAGMDDRSSGNTLTVIAGSVIGLLFRKGIPKRVADAIMIGIGLCTVYIGISGALKGENTLILILSIVIGAIVGTVLDIDKRINQFGEWISSRLKKPSDGTASIAEGFVTASLLFCIGP